MPKKPTYPQRDMAVRLRDALEESGVTQAQLARECDVTDQAVHEWVTTGRVGKHHFITISKVTNKPLEFFFLGLRRAAAIVPFAMLIGMGMPDKAHAKPVKDGCVLR